MIQVDVQSGQDLRADCAFGNRSAVQLNWEVPESVSSVWVLVLFQGGLTAHAPYIGPKDGVRRKTRHKCPEVGSDSGGDSIDNRA
jgi:hypothetical protein